MRKRIYKEECIDTKSKHVSCAFFFDAEENDDLLNACAARSALWSRDFYHEIKLGWIFRRGYYGYAR